MRTSEQEVRLLVSTPIQDALEGLDQRADEHEGWGAADTATTIRRCVQTVREAIMVASEIGASTRETAELTGWSENTLLRYAKLVDEGGTLPPLWRGVQVRRTAAGYSFIVSTVPVCPARERSA